MERIEQEPLKKLAKKGHNPRNRLCSTPYKCPYCYGLFTNQIEFNYHRENGHSKWPQTIAKEELDAAIALIMLKNQWIKNRVNTTLINPHSSQC